MYNDIFKIYFFLAASIIVPNISLDYLKLFNLK